MEVSLNRNSADVVFHAKGKWDHDEEVVRKRLVVVWTKIMEKYATPGAFIPPAEWIRQELLRVGVDAAVKAVVDEHWIVFSFMIRERIEKQVDRELDRFNLDDFLEEVKAAQQDRAMLPYLREKIRRYVLE